MHELILTSKFGNCFHVPLSHYTHYPIVGATFTWTFFLFCFVNFHATNEFLLRSKPFQSLVHELMHPQATTDYKANQHHFHSFSSLSHSLHIDFYVWAVSAYIISPNIILKKWIYRKLDADIGCTRTHTHTHCRMVTQEKEEIMGGSEWMEERKEKMKGNKFYILYVQKTNSIANAVKKK